MYVVKLHNWNEPFIIGQKIPAYLILYYHQISLPCQTVSNLCKIRGPPLGPSDAWQADRSVYHRIMNEARPYSVYSDHRHGGF